MLDQKLTEGIIALASKLIHVAEKVGNEFGEKVAEGTLVDAIDFLSDKVNALEDWNDRTMEDGQVSLAELEDLAILAAEFDKSGDPLLMKQANVIDEILLTIGTNAKAFAAAKSATDHQLDKIMGRNPVTKEYTVVKAEHDKQNDVVGAKKAIEDKVKEYRPMEAALSTRTCPDHPGAQLGRIADNTYQCSMDKGVYNFQSGYTSMKGNKIPGGDVANQTQALQDQSSEFTAFDSRESRLNQN